MENSPNNDVSRIGYVNTSGDNYDIYCAVGNYLFATTARVQSTSNATVQLFEAQRHLTTLHLAMLMGQLLTITLVS